MEWTNLEEVLLKRDFGKKSITELQVILPKRSVSAIQKRAKILGLKTCNDNITMKNYTSIEQLEVELAVKRAQLDVENTTRALDIFDELMVQNYKNSGCDSPEDWIKINAAKRGKLVKAVSFARQKLVIARIKQK